MSMMPAHEPPDVHVLDEDGVTHVPVVPTGDQKWTNATEVVIPLGGVLDVNGIVAITNAPDDRWPGYRRG